MTKGQTITYKILHRKHRAIRTLTFILQKTSLNRQIAKISP